MVRFINPDLHSRRSCFNLLSVSTFNLICDRWTSFKLLKRSKNILSRALRLHTTHCWLQMWSIWYWSGYLNYEHNFPYFPSLSGFSGIFRISCHCLDFLVISRHFLAFPVFPVIVWIFLSFPGISWISILFEFVINTWLIDKPRVNYKILIRESRQGCRDTSPE